MLGDVALLDLHDQGAGAGALDRAVLLARAGGGEGAAELPLDARDRHILALSASLGGDAMPVLLTCAGCGEAMDTTLSALALAATGAAVDGIRPPSSRDLADALRLGNAEAARRFLAARASGADPADLDGGQVDAIEARLEAAAGPEDIVLRYDCPACGSAGEATFDGAAYAWSVLARRARDVTDTVAELARAYGWTEAETLALSPARRARYRELAG